MTPDDPSPKKPRTVARQITSSGDRDEYRDKRRTPIGGVPAIPAMPSDHKPETWEDGGYVRTDVAIPRTISSPEQQLATIERRTGEQKNMSIVMRAEFQTELKGVATKFDAMAVAMQGQAVDVASLKTESAMIKRLLEEVVVERRQAQAAIQELAIGRSKSNLQREEKDADVRRTITTKAWMALITAFGTIVAAVAYLLGRKDG